MTLLELGKTPIPGGNPAGEDVRLDADFEALSGEIEKLSSPAGAGSLDWKKVVSLSSDILTHKSKDILVACYLCVGLLRIEGLDGLAKGIGVLRDMLEMYWEDLFPAKKRMKARRNAIDWWMERVKSIIAGGGTEKWPNDKKDKFVEDLKAIDAFLGENMDDAPIMAPFIASIASMIELERIEEDKPAPAAGAARPKEVYPEMDADKLLKQGLDILSRLASTIMQQEPMSALYFRLNRVVAWLSVTSLPPSTDGKTLIPPPGEQVMNVLRNLYQSGNWKDLLQAAESRVPEFLFWIDLSRYSAESLDKLGYRDVGEAVAAETSLYVKRLPGLERLAFSDGAPFAGEETREWLKSISLQAAGRQEIPAGNDVGDLYASISREIVDALELIRTNKLAEALSSFRGKLDQASSARERFIWEIGFCRLLNQAGQKHLSDPYQRELLEYIDVYKVEQWEPALAVEALTTVLSGIRLQEGEKDEGLVKRIFDRITALNPVRALDLL